MANLDKPRHGWEGISNDGEIRGESPSFYSDKEYKDDQDDELSIAEIRQSLSEEDKPGNEIEEEDYRKLMAEIRQRIEKRTQDSSKEGTGVSAEQKEYEDSVRDISNMLKERTRDFNSTLDEILYDDDVEEMKQDKIAKIIAMTDLNELDDKSRAAIKEELSGYPLEKLSSMEKQLGSPEQIDSSSKKSM